MKTLILKISYFGHNFCGFARQPNVASVQGNLENALKEIFGESIETVCAGRTDSGVHAREQVVSCNLNEEIFKNPKFNRKYLFSMLNKLTHADIKITDVALVDYSFSARFDAKARYYSYFICNQALPPFFMEKYSWHIKDNLDLYAMKNATKYLIGEHDFKSFCVSKSAVDKPTKRCINSVDLLNYKYFNENIIEMKISGNAFLHSMVRTIVGTLVDVGLAKMAPEDIQDIIAAKNRQAAGVCAPAKGLVLMGVKY